MIKLEDGAENGTWMATTAQAKGRLPKWSQARWGQERAALPAVSAERASGGGGIDLAESFLIASATLRSGRSLSALFYARCPLRVRPFTGNLSRPGSEAPHCESRWTGLSCHYASSEPGHRHEP